MAIEVRTFDKRDIGAEYPDSLYGTYDTLERANQAAIEALKCETVYKVHVARITTSLVGQTETILGVYFQKDGSKKDGSKNSEQMESALFAKGWTLARTCSATGWVGYSAPWDPLKLYAQTLTQAHDTQQWSEATGRREYPTIGELNQYRARRACGGSF